MKGERGGGRKGGGTSSSGVRGGVEGKKNVLASISYGVLKYNEQWRHHKNFFKVQEMRVMKLNPILCQN